MFFFRSALFDSRLGFWNGDEKWKPDRWESADYFGVFTVVVLCR
jgi:hypothetical protein